MKKIFLLLITFYFMTGCGDSSSSINLENYLPSDGYQKRRDGLFYQQNTQNLISGTILHDYNWHSKIFDGDSYTYRNNYYQVKDGLLHGKSLHHIHFSDQLNAARNAYGGKVMLEEPTLFQEINFKDGYVFGKVKLLSFLGDILVEGQVEDGKRVGDWQVFDGKELLTISFSNNDYTLPEGTELESNVQSFLNRDWDRKINKLF